MEGALAMAEGVWDFDPKELGGRNVLIGIGAN
jgi:hypothetical protein